MIKTIIFPGRYVQGSGSLDEAGKFIAPLGKKVLVVWDSIVNKMFSERLEASIKKADAEIFSFVFSGECSRNQKDIGIQKAQALKADVVVGVGGGKAIDLAKAIAFNTNAHMVSLPTVASNDAPTSSCSVYYTDDGVLDGFDVWPRNPDMVLADSQIIANAPVRWLVSGIGDALATWFEAEAAFKGRRPAFAGGVPTMTAMSLARLCYETLMAYGIDAKMDAENHVVTPALEKIIEANILLSGIGWESGGLATAHTLGNGLSILECTHPYSHGEKVAFGLVTQLCLDDDIDPQERLDVVDFMVELGLPVSFAELGMAKLAKDELMKAAVALTEPGNFLHNHVFTVSALDLFSAMVKADALGSSRKKLLK
ncbi:MAG: glycerol dehydrogenase [Anaerolineae bacterium]|nr:glycerol dehydrogenase [Anaerolineae bacterium]